MSVASKGCTWQSFWTDPMHWLWDWPGSGHVGASTLPPLSCVQSVWPVHPMHHVQHAPWFAVHAAHYGVCTAHRLDPAPNMALGNGGGERGVQGTGHMQHAGPGFCDARSTVSSARATGSAHRSLAQCTVILDPWGQCMVVCRQAVE